jgi:tetratricopeptide (TPR) repeat protein
MMYLFFFIAFLLVEEDMFNTAISLYNKALSLIEDKNYDLRTSCLYNIGILNYALGNVCEGIHHLEEAYRVNMNNNLSIKTLLKIQDTLSLTYIDQKSFRKAYCMIQQGIGIRNLSSDDSELLESTKHKFYINFIIDYIEYEFTLLKKHNICIKILYLRE